MKIKFILTIAGAFCLFFSSAQELKTDWITSAGGASYDQANALDVDKEGNLFVTGYFQNEAFFGSEKVNSSGDTDVYLVKYDKSGKVIWVRTGGSDYRRSDVISESGTSLTVDKQGNAYVAGSFRRVACFEKQKITSAGKDDIFLAKYSKTGDLLWVRRAGGSSQDIVQDIITDKDGDVYITGYFQNEVNFEDVNFHSAEHANFFIAKYNSEGNLIWVKNAQQTDASMGRSLVAFNNEVFVTGNFKGRMTLGGHSIKSLGYNDIFIAKFSSQGNCNALIRHGGIGDESVKSMDVTDDNILLTGGYQVDDDATGNSGCFVSALSLGGDHGWIKRFKGDGASEGRVIRSVGKDQIIVAGDFLKSIDISGQYNNGHESGDIFLLELDNRGGIKWTDIQQSEGRKSVTSMITLLDGSVILAGAIAGDLNIGALRTSAVGKSDILLRKIQPPVKKNGLQLDKSEIQAYPNPSNGHFNLSYNFSKMPSRNRITITDVTGKIVYEKFVFDGSAIDLPIELTSVGKGIYNVQLISDDIELYKKIMIK